jgi:predicted Zn finger-like uncharacterized protein
LPQLEFRCIKCRQPFFVPSEAIPAAGGRGRCTGCGTALIIFPNGIIRPGDRDQPSQPARPDPPPAPPAPAASTPPPDNPIWEIKSAEPEVSFSPLPHTLADIREKIIERQLHEGDFARIVGADWQPIRAYPALMKLFAERAASDREVHGDIDHCVHHPEELPAWHCPKCGDFFCKQCVANRPLIAGGAPNYLCLVCEVEVEPVKRGPNKGLVPGLFKKG